MSRIPWAVKMGLMFFALLAVACGQDGQEADSNTTPGAVDSIAGTYNCGPGGQPAQDVAEVREDGTVTITQPGSTPEPGAAMTWSIEGDRGAFNTPEGPDRFRVEGDRLVFDDGFVCTKKAG